MPKVLSDAQITRFHDQGFLAPLDLMKETQAGHLDENFRTLEETYGGEVSERFRIKAHLPFPGLCDLIRHPRLLDVVEDIVGPDILCWGATFFIKKPRDQRFISWHTDSFFYGTRPAETLTAWVSFNISDIESGCMRFIPGSHKTVAVHELRPDPNNMSSNGQTVLDVDESVAVDVVLRPGQFSLHHESVVHASSPNMSDRQRIGFSIHYCPPHVRETRFDGATAMLLRGEDSTGNWLPDPEPEDDFDPVCIEMMDRTLARFRTSTNENISAGGKS
jgi:hypothetical protein